MMIKHFYLILWAIAQAAAMLMLAHYGYGWAAVLVVVAPQVAIWLRGQRTAYRALEAFQATLAGLSIALIIGLSRQSGGGLVFPPVTQILLSVVYAGLLIWRTFPGGPNRGLVLAAMNQVFATTAIFLISTFWHWPAAIIVALQWAVSFVVAWSLLRQRQESAAAILAATWALVSAEVAWVLQLWLVNYILASGYIIIPQAALILLGLGYCFANIYLAHTSKVLSRRRLLEYVTITAVLLAIVIAGTRWSGTS